MALLLSLVLGLAVRPARRRKSGRWYNVVDAEPACFPHGDPLPASLPRLSTLVAALVVLGGVCSAEDGGPGAWETAMGAARAEVQGMKALTTALPASAPAPDDPCAGERRDPPVRSGEDKTIWAETSACLPFSLAKLWEASLSTDVMVWEGITRINGVTVLGADGPQETVRRRRIDYESRKRHMGCHTAHFPMEWAHRITSGGVNDPAEAVISFTKVDGADFNGSFIKVWKGRVELRASSAGQTALRMRYEISAPTQTPESAAGAVRAYIARLKRRAEGGALPGPVDNPDCPY